jgi:CheY-like chemotaxis protein
VFVELMVELLGTGEGYDVVSNCRPVESFDFIKREQPDLVMLDLMMGRQETGWVILDLLRGDPQTRDVPVILCSAAVPSLRHGWHRLHDEPAVEAIAKPFDIDDLVDLIARMLERHRSARSVV